jgi:hypothetical protein
VTTDSNHDLPVYPNLAGDMVLTGIDQLWVAFITYIRRQEAWPDGRWSGRRRWRNAHLALGWFIILTMAACTRRGNTGVAEGVWRAPQVTAAPFHPTPLAARMECEKTVPFRSRQFRSDLCAEGRASLY